MPPHRVFISLRFSEAMEESEALKKALDKRGVPTFLCAVASGNSIADAVIEAIDECDLVVIMGTHTYGEKTDSKFSSREELEFIINDEKPFFLVKMCDRFKHAKTRFWLPPTIAYHPWQPQGAERSDPPGELVDAIIAKLKNVSGVGAPATQQQPQQQQATGTVRATSLATSSPSSASSSQVHGVRAVSGGGAEEDAVRKLQASGRSMHAAEVVQLMHAFPASADVQWRACQALEDQSRGNPSARVQAAAAGAIDAVMRTLTTHSQNADVQERACAALANLAINNDNKVAIAAKGGIEIVVAAMNRFSSNGGVQHQGCVALAELACNDANKMAIVSKGGVDAVIAAMQNHGKKAVVQNNGCVALGILARHASVCQQLRSKRVAVVAEQAKRNLPANAAVQDQANRLLRQLA
ncbi:hypothetical protein PTSG_09915 [Salpingoeca rosetta]|uniref:Uncharacterized protein n=1 Tax=Salpingoeca rosetta (strain ATCC 50818 / BSB-021) TaxID=946362 RepID=F2UNI1_SALR5|nr:uncharacterized protein PTSG_09915 [Salpingoeca rosetta]EGD79186.1 hypothetical protein PTSG_09915 [Salpingoeca rosetta]|eukprot:XP_004989271.1 hypothetical protein PTSG_09915 [Salpingoeca rosetta]